MIEHRDVYPFNLSMGRMDVSPAEMDCARRRFPRCVCGGHLEVVREGPCRDPKLKVFAWGDDACHLWLLRCLTCSNLTNYLVMHSGWGKELRDADKPRRNSGDHDDN